MEVSDQEWEAEMQEDFENSGLMHTRGKRGILSKVPKGNQAFKILCILLLLLYQMVIQISKSDCFKSFIFQA